MSGLASDALIGLAILGVSLYFPLNRIKAPGRWFFHDTWFDEYVPLVPYFIIPYLALFPYMFATLLVVWSSEWRMEFVGAIAVAAWSAGFVWYFFPAGILRKREIGPDFLSRMIIWIYEHDHENNTFPSSHVFYALICSYYLACVLPDFALVFALLGGLITISTVLVKQHHLADILGGIMWAVGAIWLAQLLVA